jgi:polyhydroxybutyrate depolymerase
MGGMLSFRLACELPERIAGFASVASTMPEYVIPYCNGSPPVPGVIFQGTDDQVVPWRGVSRQGIGFLSAAVSLLYWAQHNDCTGSGALRILPDLVPEDGMRVLVERYTDCADNADVTLYGVFYGGHTWPGRPINAPFELGGTTGDIDATRLIWEFFDAHPKG